MSHIEPALIEMTIAPKDQAGREKLIGALGELALHDPSFRFSVDPESGQIVVKGTSERHLDEALSRLQSTNGMEFDPGAPQIAFRESLTKSVTVEFISMSPRRDGRQHARVELLVEPTASESGNVVCSNAVDGSVAPEYIAAVGKGVMTALSAGIVAGFPVTDVTITLTRCVLEEPEALPPAFEKASRMAMREALLKGGSILLEPIMKVEVLTPADYVNDVARDLLMRHSQVRGRELQAGAVRIEALVPLNSMFGYGNYLRYLTQARATFPMQFSHYDPVASPPDDTPFPPAVGMRA